MPGTPILRYRDEIGVSLLDGLDGLSADLPDDDEDGHVPPLPPPLPRISRWTVPGVLAIVVGFLLFLFHRLLPIGTNVVMLAGFGAIPALRSSC